MRTGAEISVDGDVVTKLHRSGTDPRALTTRLHVAAQSACMLSPMDLEPTPVAGRWQTRWPRVDTVPVDPTAVPWAEAGQLLANFHTEAGADFTVPHGGPARLTRALGRLGRGPDADAIRRAAAGVRVTFRPERPATLVHGDWHLGQLGRRSADAPWILLDVDDLGVGDPAWDLARPAGFWAAGLIPDADWVAFVDSYRDGGGPAVPSGDPWTVLEPFARAAVVTAAANQPDDLLVAACARMP